MGAYELEKLRKGETTTGLDGKRIEIMRPNVDNFPKMIFNNTKTAVCDPEPGKLTLFTRFAMALGKKIRKYQAHLVAEDELKNNK
jgi:hypothetical protein